MGISMEKRKRLAYVARRYYLDDQRQSDIARELGISRPMVSRLLAEARELGVVEITVHDPETRAARLMERLRGMSSVRGGVLIEDSGDNDDEHRRLSEGAVQLLGQLGAKRLGVGWGYLIGQIVSWLEKTRRRTAPSRTSAPSSATPASPRGTISPTRTYASWPSSWGPRRTSSTSPPCPRA